MAPLVAAYAGLVPTMACAASDKRKTMNGAPDVDASGLSKSSTAVSSMVAAFETPALATRMSRRSPTMLRVCLASLSAPSAVATWLWHPRGYRLARL
jgi:hypothetical protein